jgi:molybdopterin synthase sulfur carrier subunit
MTRPATPHPVRAECPPGRDGRRAAAVGGTNGELSRRVCVVLPSHLRTLARIGGEVQLEIEGAVTQKAILDALEARYPMLRGTIRDHATGERRAYLRFFACREDLSHEPPESPLPEAVASGAEPFLIVGAIAGG